MYYDIEIEYKDSKFKVHFERIKCLYLVEFVEFLSSMEFPPTKITLERKPFFNY